MSENYVGPTPQAVGSGFQQEDYTFGVEEFIKQPYKVSIEYVYPNNTKVLKYYVVLADWTKYFVKGEDEPYEAFRPRGDLSRITFQNIPANIITLETISKPGYTSQWKAIRESNAVVMYESGGAFLILNETDTITGIETVLSYTASFDANGGSSTPGSATVVYGSTYTLPGAISRTGYRFDGWKAGTETNKGAGTQFNWYYTSNTTFTAQWTAQYTATWDYNGGIGSPGSNTANYNESLAIPNTPTKTGYRFDGWKTGLDTYTANFTYSYSSAKTFTAQWTAKSYIITWAYDGGTQGSQPTTSIKYDETLTFPTTAPTKAGNTFTGWKTGSDTYAASTPNYVWKYDVDKTFTAQWSAAYTVTFAPDGGSTTPVSNTATIGLSYILPAAISRTGYDFDGWKTGTDPKREAGYTFTSWSYAANTTFTALWIAKSYTITWLYDGGTLGTIPPASINYGSTLSLPTPTKAGYKFTGWKTESDIRITNFDWNYDNNITFTAQWSLQAFVATWNYAGGTPNTIETTPINLNQTLQLPNPAPSKIGYIFAGWKTGSDTYTASFEWTYTVDKTFTAQWTARTYTIAYNDNLTAITGLTPTTVSYDQIIEFPTPSKTGYTFVAWYTDTQFSLPSYSGEYKWDFTTSKTFYAKYTINIYNISYYDNTTLLPSLSPSSANYSVSYTLPKPSKNGYRFDAWYLNAVFTGDPYKETITWNFLTDIKFYAKYSVTYSITYKDGTNTLTLEPTFGVTSEQYTLPSGPSKTGYTFNAWYIYDNFSGQSYTGTNTWNFPSGQTFYAKYSPITYTIKYYDGLTRILSLSPTSATFGQQNFVFPTASKTGYTFEAWYANFQLSEGPYSGLITWNFSENKIFYAKFAPIRYFITYKDVGTTLDLTPTSILYGTQFIFPTAPIKSGYVFDKWADTSNVNVGPYYSGEITWNFASNKFFFTKYTAITYTINYYDHNVNTLSLSPTSIQYGSPYMFPTPPTRPGYFFFAWYQNSLFNGSSYMTSITNPWTFTSDQNFYTKYTRRTYYITYIDIITGSTLTLSPSSIEFDRSYTFPTPPQKPGYTFDAWYTTSDASGALKYVSSEGINWTFLENTTFYAKYIAITYYILYYDNIILLNLSPTSVVYNTRFTLPTPAAKPNYTFAGWSKYSNGSTPTYNGEILYDDTDDINFYAKYILNAVTLIWDRNNIGGNTRTDYNVVVNSSVTAPTPKAVGYTFAGWYNSSTGGTLQVNGNSLYTMPSSATTLYARWTDNGNIKFSDLKSTYNLTNPIKISTIFGLVGFSTTAPKKLIENFKGKGPNY